jgi:transposase
MRVETILNSVEKHAGFVYTRSARVGQTLEVTIRPRANSRPQCVRCGQRGPVHDRLEERRYEFVPLWGYRVFLVYRRRRVACRRCGVHAEQIPWAQGKQQLTTTYAWFLARWAKRLSWIEVARTFQTSWNSVYRAVAMAVAWGRAHMVLDSVAVIGVDEVQWQWGHKYLTVVYEISAQSRRLLWVGREREEATLRQFFEWFGVARSHALRFICSDMWQPYVKVIAEKAQQAVHVLDRFHVVAKLNKAIDEVRAQEAKALKGRGKEPVLSKTRWCLLKRPERLTEKQDHRLAELLRYNLRTVRGYLLKEDFQLLWNYRSVYWAGWFLDRWCTRAMRSRIEPMKKIARSLREHRPLILNWFRARGEILGGAVEGLNNKLKLVTRRAYGFRSFRVIEVALYHTLGRLPEPEGTHRFC